MHTPLGPARRPHWISFRIAPKVIVLALLTLAATLALGAQQAVPVQRRQSASGVQSSDMAIVLTVQALFSAAERNDMTALDTLYAGDSLTVVEGAGINRGWPDYRDHHLAPELKEMKNFRYHPFEIEARVSGDLAWAMFRYALAADMKGKPIEAVGRGTAILERRGSKWVVRHTQTASRPRRPTDPPMPG